MTFTHPNHLGPREGDSPEVLAALDEAQRILASHPGDCADTTTCDQCQRDFPDFDYDDGTPLVITEAGLVCHTCAQIGPIVRNAQYHRNGVGGEGFFASIVTDPWGSEFSRGNDFLIITLPDAVYVNDDGSETVEDRSMFTFVLKLSDLADGTVQNCWRGDRAATSCRDAIIAKAREAYTRPT
jgi:hypothetical protein